MKKLITICAVLAGMTATAYCEPRPMLKRQRIPLVTRQAADVYVGIGTGEVVRTRGCTVTAQNTLAMIDGGPRPFLIFIDRSGEEEGRCEIETGKKARRVITAEPKRPIRRQIALVR